MPKKRKPLGAQGRAGNHVIPRSLGLTFEYIRRGLHAEGLKAFGQRLQAEPSPFEEDTRTDPSAESSHSRISLYEQAMRDPIFGTQHKYASLSESYTGVIHLISLFYALLRCGANEQNNKEAQEEKLREAAALVRKLRALVDAADQLVATAEREGVLEKLKGPESKAWVYNKQRLERATLVMKPLFDAFQKG